MSDPLDQLGGQIDAALRARAPGLRRRRRLALAAGLCAVGVAVPATGSVVGLGPLAGGETALPTQVPPGLRVSLAAGRDAAGPWQLELYRARLAGQQGAEGVCLFASRERGGVGRCTDPAQLGALVSTGDDPSVAVTGGLVDAEVTRVELTVRLWSGGRQVVALQPQPVPGQELERRGLRPGLRSYAAVLPDGQLAGARALSTDGRTLATSGRPSPPSPATSAEPSPSVSSTEVSP